MKPFLSVRDPLAIASTNKRTVAFCWSAASRSLSWIASTYVGCTGRSRSILVYNAADLSVNDILFTIGSFNLPLIIDQLAGPMFHFCDRHGRFTLCFGHNRFITIG